MSVLFITVENFMEQSYGGTVATYNCFKAMSTADTTLVCYYDQNRDNPERVCADINKEFNIKGVKLIPFQIRIRNNVFMLLRAAIIMVTKAYPYLAAKFFTKDLVRVAMDSMKLENPEIVYIDHMNLAFLAEFLKKIGPKTRIILINHNDEYGLAADFAKRRKGLFRFIANIEGFLIDKFQKKNIQYIDDIKCISGIDANRLRKKYNTNKFSEYPVPYAVNYDYSFNDIEKNSVGMCGSLSWPLTVEGLEWYLEKVHPYLCARVPDYKLLIAGSNAGNALIRKLQNTEHVIYYGFVANLQDFYKKCKVAIVPSLSESGIKIKVLTAFSNSVPVVATKKAVQGLGVINGVHLLFDDDPKIFAENIMRLSEDCSLRKALSKNAYDYAKKVHG